MDTSHKHPHQSAAAWTLLGLGIPLLWWVSHPAWQILIEPRVFAFWHSVVEMFAVVVAMLVFVTGYRSILAARRGAVVVLGVAFFGVGLLDLLHTLSYSGMPDAMTPNSPQKSIIFWLAGRMLAAAALLVYALLPTMPDVSLWKKRLALVTMLAAVAALGYVGLLWPDRMPALFIPGQGLTPLKIGIERSMVVVNLATIAVLWHRRQELVQECVMALGFAAALSAVSELFFTMLGAADKDGANVLGHIYKVAAYLYLFHATFNEALRRPLERMEAQTLREKRVLSSAPDGVLWVDHNGQILMANPAMETLSGYSPSQLVGQNVDIFLPAQLRARHAQSMRDYFAVPRTRAMGLIDLKLLRRDGRMLPVDISLSHWDDGGARHAIAYIRDLTERRQAEAELRVAATAFESQEGMVITDSNSVILKVNRAFTQITGYTAKEVVGQTPNLLRSGRHDSEFYREMWETIHRTGGWQGEIWDRRKNGEVYPKWLTISAVKGDDDTVTHYVGTHHDITERKRAEDKIHELAFFDQLTGIPNRTLLLDRLRQALAASSRSGSYGALLFIDLDNFKTLNDTQGHEVGDVLLRQVAQRLKPCLREGDTVARLGGDEFVVLLVGLSSCQEDAAADTEVVAAKVLDSFKVAHQLGEISHHSTASIGVTLFNDGGASVDDLMKQADLAMYKSKKAGRNLVSFFDPTLESSVKDRVALENDLRQAVAQNQFRLHYQAQVVDEGRLTGAEVLVRWQHPRRGVVPPADFIPLAEETGLILPLGQWVLETACTQLAIWAARPDVAHLTIAVNVSATQFHRKDFVEQVLSILDSTGANPQRLKLELTESLLVSNVNEIIEKMSALKAKGVGFSLDDFGTGYSSLSYLKRLPLDQLKIDQSFVNDVLSDPNDAAIARTIIALARSLGLGVIAEGVETAAQRDFLADSGCHAYQGYFFSRPLPLQEFDELATQFSNSTVAGCSPQMA